MKSIRLLLIITIFIAGIAPQKANAGIWRVNNFSDYNGTTLFGANFGGTYLHPVFKQPTQAAGSALVAAGDTLHIEGSTETYNILSLSKRLVLIGAGYFTELNPKTSASLLPSEIHAITIKAAAEGSQIIGMTVLDASGIVVQASNVLIKRCKLTFRIQLAVSITDILIIGNFFLPGTASAIDITTAAPANVILNNNIFQRPVVPVSDNGIAITTFQECKNNVFDCPVLTGKPSLYFNCLAFENNILKNANVTININNNTNQHVRYNFSGSANGQFGTADGNQVVDMTALFVDGSSAPAPDGKYQLKPGSAVGSDGTERGAYGGAAITNRYALSGLAPIPVIYNISTSGVADASGLPVTISARTIN